MRTICVFIAALIAVAVSPTNAEVRYRLIDLGTLGNDSYAYAVNNTGIAVGRAYLPQTTSWNDACSWEGGQLQDIGASITEYRTSASAINDNGIIVGSGVSSDWNTSSAWRWENGIGTQLSTLGGKRTGASDINSLGVIAGTSALTGDTYSHACVWRNGVIEDLDNGQSRMSYGNAINDLGQVAGTIRYGSSDRASIWINGTSIDLGVLPGDTSSSSHDINDSGQVIGDSRNINASPQTNRGFIWQNGVMTDLGMLAGYSKCYTSAINNSGQVVGNVDGTSPRKAFIWENGVMTDLNTLIEPGSNLRLSYAYDISDSGYIVGAAYAPYDHGYYHGYLLAPVPEPSSLFALMSGAGFLVCWKRSIRKRRF